MRSSRAQVSRRLGPGAARARTSAVLAAVVLAAGALAVPASAREGTAEPAALQVRLAPGQTTDLDPELVAYEVGWSAPGCPDCALWRVRSGRAGVREERLAGTGATTDRWGPEPLLGPPRYEVRTADGAVLARSGTLLPGWTAETSLPDVTGWAREVDLTATETLVLRAGPAGASASVPGGLARQVGVVAPRGPQGGRLVVRAGDGAPVPVDLTAPEDAPRSVVAVLDVAADVPLTVTADPGARFDGLLDLAALGAPEPSGGVSVRPGRKVRAVSGSGVSVRPAGQLRTDGAVRLVVQAPADDCSAGCRLTSGGTVLLERVAPGPQDLRVAVSGTPAEAAYALEVGGAVVAASPRLSVGVVPDAAYDLSDGWTTAVRGAATDGSVLRTAGAGAGATWRTRGTATGRTVGLLAAPGPRGGVVAVFVDGRPAGTVDLRGPVVRARQVVLALDLPLRGRVTVVDATPPERGAHAVELDGLVVLDDAYDGA